MLFSLWVPETFPNLATAKQILNANAITALAALSITIPLAARVFDLSFAGVMTLTGVVVAHLIAKDGVPLVPAIALALAVGLGIGVINAVVVVVMRIDSFIATLATGSLIAALITMVTNEVPITDAKLGGGVREDRPDEHRRRHARRSSTAPWWRSPSGTCSSTPPPAGACTPPASTRTPRGSRACASTACASCRWSCRAGWPAPPASSSRRCSGAGRRRAGTPYLLPAFAAAFLGATQLKHGRFNAGGTIIAVLLLGTGVTGLALANAPQWAGDMFVGVVLIAALALTGLQRRTHRLTARDSQSTLQEEE